MTLIIGLGNPGEKYEKTRHNVAWLIFDSLNKNFDWQNNKYAKANLAMTNIDAEDIIFIKPETFMNKSGEILKYFEKEFKITNEDLIVIHDDIDLPFGKIKISYDRGDGGHNGVKSIMDHLGSKLFTRIRVGVSLLDENNILRKPDVLSTFSSEEIEIIKKSISPSIAKILETIIIKGRGEAMNKFNTN